MKKSFVFLLVVIWCWPTISISQNEVEQDSLDLKYREDQFYIGVTYNLLRKLPDNVAQNGFSSGFHFGFIRDMPINKNRTLAIGLGLGYSGNSINQNLRLTENSQNIQEYDIVESGSFSKNKISIHKIEAPFELRWRTSTSTDYRFWRIYSGVKFGYVIASSAKYKGDLNNVKVNRLDNINSLQYGLTLTAGYDKFNAHIYYALNPIFNGDVKIDSNTIDLSLIKIGLMLYIL